jgi:hypothetical protein
MLQQPETQVVS